MLLSAAVWWYLDETTPSTTPRIMLITIAKVAICNVYGSVCAITVVTGTKPLDGENPKQAKFLKPEDGMRTNPNGELIDPWGTPYFFHQLSGHEMEIRSAGPDKIMWTADDLVTK